MDKQKLTGPVVFRRVRGRIVAMRMREGSDIHQATKNVNKSANAGFAKGAAGTAAVGAAGLFGYAAATFHGMTRPFAKSMGVSAKYGRQAAMGAGRAMVGKYKWALAAASYVGGIAGYMHGRKSAVKREGAKIDQKYMHDGKISGKSLRKMGFSKIYTIRPAK